MVNIIPMTDRSSPLRYNGQTIADRDEMLSLTDMWKAAGSNAQQKPVKWIALPSTSVFVQHVSEKVGFSDLLRAERGRGGGTFAHWQIALAYAKYLSPDFHMWCNQVVRERMEGTSIVSSPAPDIRPSLTEDDRIVIGNIVKNCVGAVIREQIQDILPRMVEAYIAQSAVMIRKGKTAGQIWNEARLPKMKSASNWLGNRLAEMGCQIEHHGKAELGSVSARLFDPDKADICMRNGLRDRARRYIQHRTGQTVLMLR